LKIQLDAIANPDKRVVDAVAEASVLYVDGRPWQVIRNNLVPRDPRTVVKGDTIRVYARKVQGPFLPGTRLFLEWINFNPHSGEIERLRSKEITIGNKRLVGP
jgi:hypothetical protein